MTDHLEPCPFCGMRQLDFEQNEHGRHYVMCLTCGCEGPWTMSKPASKEDWNRRAPAPQPAFSEADKLAEQISGGCKDGHPLIFYTGENGCPVCEGRSVPPAQPADRVGWLTEKEVRHIYEVRGVETQDVIAKLCRMALAALQQDGNQQGEK